jgi:ketosteroid isomerase-like protein
LVATGETSRAKGIQISQNTEAVNGAYEAFASGDVPAIVAIVEDGAEWVSTASLPQGGSFSGPDGAAQFFQGVGEAWEELNVEVDDLLDAGDHVVGVGRANGKLRNGNSAGYGFTHIFTMNDGKIARFREHADPDETLRRRAA